MKGLKAASASDSPAAAAAAAATVVHNVVADGFGRGTARIVGCVFPVRSTNDSRPNSASRRHVTCRGAVTPTAGNAERRRPMTMPPPPLRESP